MLENIPNAKKQISAAFIPFVDEMQSELDYMVDKKLRDLVDKKDGYLYMPQNTAGKSLGTRLVYNNIGVIDDTNADGKKSIIIPSDDFYSFSSLPHLLDTIARVTINYCKIMDNKKPIKGTRGQVVPYFIRRTCALVCYTLLKNNTGVCTQIMRDLHGRTTALGYEYF